MHTPRFFRSRAAFTLLIISACLFFYYVALCVHNSSFGGFSLMWLFADLAGICVCLITEKRKRLGKRAKPGKKTRIFLAAALFSGMVILVLDLAFILRPVKGPETDSPYLLVLGAGIRRNGSVSVSLAQRLETALAYLSAYPRAMVIVSGGQGASRPFPESNAMAAYLRERGVERERIIEEDASRDTIQNLRFSRRIIREREGKDVPVIILTSDFHLSRALFLAERAGYPGVTGLSSPSSLLARPNVYAREILAVIKLCLRLAAAPDTVSG
ncbi:MAG: YdcF family protein [Treponema sp.]|nr:YdcF family protein [Treponema sp.]